MTWPTWFEKDKAMSTQEVLTPRSQVMESVSEHRTTGQRDNGTTGQRDNRVAAAASRSALDGLGSESGIGD